MAKSKTNKPIVTNCAEIEILITKIAKELMDREVEPRLSALVSDYKSMKREIHSLSDQQIKIMEDFIPALSDLHKKLDLHTLEETKVWNEFREELSKASNKVHDIQNTLDNVAANGNKGLGASFSDIYGKLKDLESITKPARARAKFWVAVNNLIESTPLMKPLRTKWGLILYSIVLILIANTIFHSFGLEFDVMTILKWLVGKL